MCFNLFSLNSAYGESRYRVEIYGSSTYQEINEQSRFNPDNQVLKIPEWSHVLELRPDVELNFLKLHSVILRSRHFLTSHEMDTANPTQTRTSIGSESDLTDLFISSEWKDHFSTHVGLQNYQWGPAEILSPSNVFFHFDNNQRSFFYKEKGRAMMRVNWNPDPDSSKWSVVGIYEPTSNHERFWTADREFRPKSALKIEYQFENPINAVALIFGQGEKERFYFGEYFTWSPKEGISIYGDLKHQSGETHFVPEQNLMGTYDLVDSDEDSRYFTLAVVGFRWEGRIDLRQEFIWNEPGYTQREWHQAKAAALVLGPNLPRNIERFSRPGLEFRRQSYSYTSLRIPDLGKGQKHSAAIRWLSSLSETSSALQVNWEYLWKDSTVLSAEALHFMGGQGTEFRLLSDTQASIGFRWSY